MIHEEICTYEVCKLAKEKGFNVPTAEFEQMLRGGGVRSPMLGIYGRKAIKEILLLNG